MDNIGGRGVFHQNQFRSKPLWIGLLWLCVAAVPAAAAHYNVVYNFCQQTNCTDGALPRTNPPILDHSGSGILYGATNQGGDTDQGTVYSLAPNGDGIYRYHRLYSFCEAPFDCPDGYQPNGPLVQDSVGNLYGINEAVVYELSPNKARTEWRISRKKTFGDGFNLTGGLTYAGASQGLAYDGRSPLYGMTFAGGAFNGTVYQLTPAKHSFRRKVLYSFCAQPDCADGYLPSGAVLLVDGNGTLYGTTEFGGAHDSGVLFQLKPNTRKTKWTETILYDFCAQPNCADGRQPLAGVVQDQSGDLYGTTSFSDIEGESGTLYKFHLGRHPKFSVLHSFCQTDCADGATPDALTFDLLGNLIGTTLRGKSGTVGALFSVDLRRRDGSLTVLHEYCCTDGSAASGAVAVDRKGNLFGTTSGGGAHFGGVVFELTP